MPLFVLLLLLAVGEPAVAVEAPGCTSREAGSEAIDVQCVVPASATRLRFTAQFLGVHDDTRLVMRATLDGAALACDAGSRTRVQGEEGGVGEVALECRAGLGTAGAPRELAVRLEWYHAQYSDSGFTFE